MLPFFEVVSETTAAINNTIIVLIYSVYEENWLQGIIGGKALEIRCIKWDNNIIFFNTAQVIDFLLFEIPHQ